MNVFQMVTVVVAMLVLGAVAILHQVKGFRSKQEIESSAKLREEIKRLEERVQTLERIATDKKSNLREEIESL